MGDVVEKITTATGIKKLVKFIAGEDCGCDERKSKLNKMFPTRKPLCLTEEEYQWMTKFRSKKSDVLTREESSTLADIYTRVFQLTKRYYPCSCTPQRWNELISDLNNIYMTYEAE
jgi:hypothetical protein